MSTMPAKAADPRQIALVSQARRALAESRSIDEVKDIRDKAEAMRLYLRQRDESLEAQNAAAEIKLWAERRAGEMLAQLPRDRGGRPTENPSKGTTGFAAPKLSDLGITRDESSRFQTIASIPEPEFVEHIEQTKAADIPLTTAGVMRQAQSNGNGEAPPKPPRLADNPLHVLLQRVFLTIANVEAAPGLHSHGWGGFLPYVRGLSAKERACIRAQIEHVRDHFQQWLDVIDQEVKE